MGFGDWAFYIILVVALIAWLPLARYMWRVEFGVDGGDGFAAILCAVISLGIAALWPIAIPVVVVATVLLGVKADERV